MSGPTPDRKYFPAAAAEYGARDQSVLPLPGTVQPPKPALSQNGSRMVAAGAQPVVDYSAMEGMPAGLNGPNVIVVDTSSLKTREEEEKVNSKFKFFSKNSNPTHFCLGQEIKEKEKE